MELLALHTSILTHVWFTAKSIYPNNGSSRFVCDSDHIYKTNCFPEDSDLQSLL